MKYNAFSLWSTRSACCSALLAVYFCFCPRVSEAQLTQADIAEAVRQGLEQYGLGSSGWEYYYCVSVLDGNGDHPIEDYLLINGVYYGIGYQFGRYADYIRELLPKVTNDVSRIRDDVNFLALAGTNIMDLVASIERVQHDMEFRHDGHGSELLVAAPDLEHTADNVANSLDYIEESVAQLLAAVMGMVVEQPEAVTNIIKYLDKPVEEDVTNAYIVADTDYDSEEQQGKDEFEGIALPDISDSYQPSFEDSPLSQNDLGMSNVDPSGSHNALIKLVSSRGSSGAGFHLPGAQVLPDIEIDLGRMGSLESGMSSFSTWASWLYDILFGLLFSVKGLTMWRVCRIASIAGACGEQPTIHLAYNPF